MGDTLRRLPCYGGPFDGGVAEFIDRGQSRTRVQGMDVAGYIGPPPTKTLRELFAPGRNHDSATYRIDHDRLTHVPPTA